MLLIRIHDAGNGSIFRRTVRDKEGHILKILEFAPQQPVDVSAEDLPSVLRDIGRALMPCEFDGNHRIRLIPLEDIDLKASVAGEKKPGNKKAKKAPVKEPADEPAPQIETETA